MTGEEKNLFRRRKPWLNFRKVMLKSVDNHCEVCGVHKNKGLNIHHTQEDDYENLDKDLFIVLCKSCHKELHRLMRRKSFDIDLYLVAFRDAFKRSKG